MKKISFLGAWIFCLTARAFGATDAEIVLLIGNGEERTSETAPWVSAVIKHLIPPGGFVKTLANSQMGLLLPDRTQMRLNQNSQLQIKSASDSAEWAQTNVKLNAGRAWSQARPKTEGDVSQGNAARLSMETPSVTMSIRGTDWEVEVLPDGSTQLVVLSGTVEMANEHGSVRVEKGEAARATSSTAPVKFQLVNPKQRVQWVSSWRPNPVRWGGNDIDAAARIAADGQMSLGNISGAIQMLDPIIRSGKAQPTTTALLARVLARDDRLSEARRLLETALVHSSNQLELLLAAGDLAILDGDVPAARHAYARALEQNPDTAEAWYGIGLIESERENVESARGALDRALKADPDHGTAQSERAIVETFAGNLTDSKALFDELLAREPDNFSALTALGINLLKSGHPQDALESFLRAGTIEPRYARAWLYSGVAFYQLGERSRALEAFGKAAELDAKDPLPHLMASLVLADALDYGNSIFAAQRAQERMPYLKSLNQVANDQKGSANLGSGFANFGLQEWAGYYANEAYSPFWAGSHLFSADRYTGSFAKNSELFQGFLTDPTAFGASNRNSTLIAAPGHYGKVDLFLERAAWKQGAVIGTANGLAVTPVPFAYFVSGDLSTTSSRDDPSSGVGKNYTIGLGVRPQHDLGIFAFVTNTDISADLRTASLADDRLDQKDRRADMGFNFKLRSNSQLWFKVGTGYQSSTVAGAFASQTTASSLNRAFNTNIFRPAGQLDRYQASSDQDDIQFRQSIGSDDRIFSWGLEQGHTNRPGELVATFAPVRLRFSQDQSLRSTDLYLSGKWKRREAVSFQGDLWFQTGKINRSDLSTLDVIPTPGVDFTLQNIPREQRYSELNPRLGVTWHVGSLHTVRLVSQRWRRPASVSTLGPVDTEGVAINDRLPMAGGLYSRTRLQFDREFAGRWYAQAFMDRERIDNGVNGIASIVPDIELTELESLRNRRDVFTAVQDIEQTPQFAQGIVDTLGLAGNVVLDARQTLSARYLYRSNHQLGGSTNLAIPYVPRSMLRLSSQRSFPERWLLGLNATFRSSRFMDAQNLQPLKSGWALGMNTYWESIDKRSSIQVILDNLLSDRAAGINNKSHLTMRYTYKF